MFETHREELITRDNNAWAERVKPVQEKYLLSKSITAALSDTYQQSAQ